ncbi:hypothetical protein [Chitinophaga sp. Cy-1792]|uniref:hypothetical protein n=1 Tax=Chitinophaga sp. Cy-1792 TaxID=2608339 RepID=UPI0014247C8D|nr:hypothetical protein [Chitinophaga sp. Cy-1792]NIG54559.1 hypothetical protein [Chitinophaga sp. Cy-1792]
MPIKVDSVEMLRQYFQGVVDRANHHAQNVDDVIYGLLGIIILRKDPNTNIEVKSTGNGATGNILWLQSRGRRLALRYEHEDHTIEIREGSYKGPMVLKIDNATTTQQILAAI